MALALLFLGVPGVRAGGPTIETELVRLVNAYRSDDLAAHVGLAGAGRLHSKDMAASGHLNHDGVAKRIRGAAPDPAESNGAPDDGFTGTLCENTASLQDPNHTLSDREIAQTIFDGWRESPSHDRCLKHIKMTAVGMGAYYDADTYKWWVTMETAEDETPPGSTVAAKTPTPATPTPRITAPIPLSSSPSEPAPSVVQVAPQRAHALARLLTPPPVPPARAHAILRIDPPPHRPRSDATAPGRGMLGWLELGAISAAGFVAFFALRAVSRSLR